MAYSERLPFRLNPLAERACSRRQPPFKTIVLHHNGAVGHDGGTVYNVSTEIFSKTLKEFTGSANHAGADTPTLCIFEISQHSSP
jgi:hypothetical protein